MSGLSQFMFNLSGQKPVVAELGSEHKVHNFKQ